MFSRAFDLFRLNALQSKSELPAFLNQISSVPVLAAVQSDLGIVLSSGLVSTWKDQSGNGFDYVQANGARQPVFTSNGLNGFPIIQFDGLTQVLISGANHALANIWHWGVARIDVWSNAGMIVGGPLGIWMWPTVPKLDQTSPGTANPVTTTVGAWFRYETTFTGGGSDYLHIGASTTSGGSAGALVPIAALALGAHTGTHDFGRCSVAAHMTTIGKPSNSEILSLDQIIAKKYGASVAL